MGFGTMLLQCGAAIGWSIQEPVQEDTSQQSWQDPPHLSPFWNFFCNKPIVSEAYSAPQYIFNHTPTIWFLFYGLMIVIALT
jgi:hypothetical protein